MAITIIVEDGTGVENANSYVDVDDARLYASNRGITLPVSDDSVAAYLIRACDYLEGFRMKYKGSKTASANYLQWPRVEVYVDGEYLASNYIPREVKQAQCELVISQNDGAVLIPTGALSSGVIEETVGPITTKYANNAASDTKQSFSSVTTILAPLFKNQGMLSVGRA